MYINFFFFFLLSPSSTSDLWIPAPNPGGVFGGKGGGVGRISQFVNECLSPKKTKKNTLLKGACQKRGREFIT